MRRRAVKIAILIISSIFILTIVAMIVVATFIFTPEKVTPLIRKAAQEHVVSDIKIGGIDISYFSSFPNFSIEIDSLVIKQINPQIDDLLSAKRCVVAVNPLALLKKEIVIDEITIEKGSINLYVDSLTRPTTLFKFESDTTHVEEESINLKEYKLSLNRFKIDSSTIVIDDREKDFYSKMGGFSVDMGLKLDPNVSTLDAQMGLEEFSVRMKKKVFASNVSLGLISHIKHYRDSSLLTLERTSLSVNEIDMNIDGSLRGNDINDDIIVDIQSNMSTPSVAEFLNLVPDYIFDKQEAVTASGNVDMEFNINGIYNEEHYPELKAKLIINDGKASYESRKLAIEKIDCDADMLIDLNEPKKSYATINKLYINTSNVLSLAVNGKVNNIINSPYLDINVDSEIDFDRLVEIFPLQKGVTLSGHNSSDLHTRFRLIDLEQSNYGNLYIDGTSNFKDVTMDIDGALFTQDSTATSYLKVDIQDGTLLFGDRVKENNSRTLLATIDVNGLGFKDKNGQYASIKNLKLTSGANFDNITKKVNGVGIRAEAQNSVIGIEDEVEMNLGSTDATFTISPKNKDRNTKIYAVINSQSIDANEDQYNSTMSLSNVDMELDMLKIDSAVWNMDGDVGFQRLKMYSDLFPLQMEIPQSRVSVLNNKITLDNARLTLGESTIVATGYITNMIRVFFFGSDAKMAGELKIQSPLLNVNELITASNKSILMREEEAPLAQDSTMLTTIEPIPADTVGMMPLVPQNIDFNFDLNIDKVKVHETFVENILGKASISKGILSLNHLTLDAIGAKAWSSLRYENLDQKISNVLFELRLNQAQINRIGELMPSVTAMLPMINSIEGNVDFDFKTTMNIDNELNVDMNTLRAASSLMGEELILKDSEDFQELADAMMFKNKNQSRIESLEIYMTADKSKVEVLPFEIAIDRYKAIIGGEQTIDIDKMNVDYKYNISVIKSPLPFKAGVDVFGVNENFDFKITKAKLKKSDFDALREEYLIFKESVK